MKLTVYDKGNSHPAMTYKGKRVVTVNRDGTIYLSKVLTPYLAASLRPLVPSAGWLRNDSSMACAFRVSTDTFSPVCLAIVRNELPLS